MAASGQPAFTSGLFVEPREDWLAQYQEEIIDPIRAFGAVSSSARSGLRVGWKSGERGASAPCPVEKTWG